MSIARMAMACSLIFGSGLISAGCDERKEVAETKAKQLAEQAEQDAKDVAEAKLMGDPQAAEQEIERRITDFVSVSSGLLIVKETRSNRTEAIAWHAMAINAPWAATCDRGRLRLGIGFPDEDGKGYVGRRLTGVRLTDDQCQRLIRTAGNVMLRMIKAP